MIQQDTSELSRIPRRILIIDDSSDTTRFSLRLKELGHVVRHFATGEAAPPQVVRMKPDFILVNIGRSNTVGHELASELKKKRQLQGARFIAISRFERRIEKRPKVEFDHYFAMPKDEDDLLAVIEKKD